MGSFPGLPIGQLTLDAEFRVTSVDAACFASDLVLVDP